MPASLDLVYKIVLLYYGTRKCGAIKGVNVMHL